MAIVFDTSAWIEYFKDTEELADYVDKIIRERSVILTSSSSIAEIVVFFLKNNKEVVDGIETIKALSKIIHIDERISINAGKINYERKNLQKKEKWGIMDSYIVAIANEYLAKILTADLEFGDLENVDKEFLKMKKEMEKKK